MVQRRGRPLKGFGDDSSSSDSDDDAFAFMSQAKKKKPRTDDPGTGSAAPSASPPTPAADAPAGKRHHHVSSARQAKMDALLRELRTTTPSDPAAARGEDYGSLNEEGGDYPGRRGRASGSYVEPGMEHLTTNLFVGNLDPMTTEEELTDAFRQFGDLYSVKIMWPRTAEERARRRNTGFVCFMHRPDAEDAMDAYCDADPLGTGRRMVLRWGKNVKKTVKFGTGGVPTNLRKKPREDTATKGVEGAGSAAESQRPSGPAGGAAAPLAPDPRSERDDGLSTGLFPPKEAAASEGAEKAAPRPVGPVYDPALHAADAIAVIAPSDPRRLKFITTVAAFVAKDGSVMEEKLIEKEAFNADFRFLTLDAGDDAARFAEHVFYRWRVYAFARGDGPNSWRTAPFVMVAPGGRFWLPPPPNAAAAQEEEEAESRRERAVLAKQEERRRAAGKKQDCATTGAQLRRTGQDKGDTRLNTWERKVFQELLREKLCASREAICEAMAFVFEKKNAAKEICGLLRDALTEAGNGISVDTRIARLLLLSDILFNSQQAFQYRDSIEAMSPDVFESLGRHGGGRMTKNKLRKAVSEVLSAWTNWSVYNSTFIDDLENKFEGRKISAPVTHSPDEKETESSDAHDGEEEDPTTSSKDLAAVSTTPRGTWTSTKSDVQDAIDDLDGEALGDIDGEELEDVDGETLGDMDGEELDYVDGEVLDDDDGEELEVTSQN